MVAWRRERSAIDATVTEVVSEASRLEVTSVRVGRDEGMARAGRKMAQPS